MSRGEEAFENSAWAGARPRLSVLIPFFRDDPSTLIGALDRQTRNNGVEIVAFDDGSNDDALTRRMREVIQTLTAPGLAVRSRTNLGRAKGRNRLATHARGEWLLFLDADMLPDSPAFLETYLDLIMTEAPAVAFGGFSLDQAPRRPEHALHRRMAEATDCVSVDVRKAAPEKYVFTSNLLVRRDVFAAEGFDETFSGWGWEDVEWAMRITKRHHITHIDNTATHLGLDQAAAMAAKYEQSAGNFARVAARHQNLIERYPSYRAARVLKRVPFLVAWRPALKAYALTDAAPLASRALAMRLYRAALYADGV